MSDFLATLLRNPRGWGESPLPYDPTQGEIRNPDDPYYGTGGPSLPARLAYLMSGIPMALEGIQGARDASLEGDPVRTAANVAQVGLSAAPFSSAINTLPRLSALLAANSIVPEVASGELTFVSPAEAASKKAKKANVAAETKKMPEAAPAPAPASVDNGLSPEENAELKTLQRRMQNSEWSSGAERRAIESRLNQLQSVSADYARSKNQAVTEAARIEATARAEREARAAKEAEEAAAREAQANEPFKKAHPWLSAAIPATTSLAALLIGGRLGYGNRKVFQEGLTELSEKIATAGKTAEDAYKAGDVLTAAQATKEAEALNNALAGLIKKGEASTLSTALAAGTIGDIGLAAPLVIDKASALPGSPLEKETNEQLDFSDPAILGQWAGRMALGALLHGGAVKGGALAGQALYGPVKIPSGTDAKATTLSGLLTQGATDDLAKVQEELTAYRRSRDAAPASDSALPGNIAPQAGNDAGLWQAYLATQTPAIPPPQAGAGGVANVLRQNSPAQGLPPNASLSPPHHSALQPRDRRGQFKGPPKYPENDN